MPEQDALWLFGSAVTLMAVTLFRPSSGLRIVLFTILIAFAVLMAVDLSIKGVVNELLVLN